MSESATAVVIGFGNLLRGDDAAGRHVAAAVARRAVPGVTVISATQLVPEIAETIASAAVAIFVDASVDSDRVVVRQLSDRTAPSDSHHTTPTGLLWLAGRIGVSDPCGFLVEVPGTRFDVGEELSPETQRALPCAVDAVVALIHAECGTAPS